MARSGRPRKQKPWRPGAPAPVQAAGCGPARRVAVAAPAKPHDPLRRTATGYAPDVLGTWRSRRKKRTSCAPGSVETIIDDRQHRAGRAVERMTDMIFGTASGKLRSFDLTVPVVDQSFRHRLGGDPELRDAMALAEALFQYLGPRDFKFLISFAGGMGIHGAMLDEAGLPWRDAPLVDPRRGPKGELSWRVPPDGPSTGNIAGAILAKGTPQKIVPEFADVTKEKSGSFDVDDRKVAPLHSRHKAPNENGFIVDEAVEVGKTTKAAARTRTSDNKADIKREARRNQLDDLAGLKDAKSKARREKLEESEDDLVEIYEVVGRALHSDRHPGRDVDPAVEAMLEKNRRNPAPNMAGHGTASFGDGNSIGSSMSFADVLYADRSTRQRAIDTFGIRATELASLRVRALLSKAADFFETHEYDREQHDTTATITPAQIEYGADIPFGIENIPVHDTVEVHR